MQSRRNDASGPLRIQSCRIAAVAALGLLLGSTVMTAAQDGPPGITKPTVFAAFDPNAPACSPPPGLEKVLAFAQDNEREFMQGVDHGLEMAAKDRGLEYRRALANNDAAKMVSDVQLLLASKVGAIVAAPVDPASLSHSLQEVMWAGGYVGTIVPPPATSLLNAPQYATGKALTDAAIAYINDKLGGKANVVLLTQDQIEFLAPRFAAMRDGLKTLPGVTIVADVTPNPVNKEGGFATMSTILQAHPDVDVVLGADTVVLGALAALRGGGQGTTRPVPRRHRWRAGSRGRDQEGRQPLQGQHLAVVAGLRLRHGRSTPPTGSKARASRRRWISCRARSPARTSPSTRPTSPTPRRSTPIPARRDAYLKMYGNICYDTRDQYVNFPWSSETK